VNFGVKNIFLSIFWISTRNNFTSSDSKLLPRHFFATVDKEQVKRILFPSNDIPYTWSSPIGSQNRDKLDLQHRSAWATYLMGLQEWEVLPSSPKNGV
jgi:hypothetical protein